MSTDENRPARDAGHLRIATEEAFAPPEVLEQYRRLLERGGGDTGFASLWGHYLHSSAERPVSVRRRLQDLGAERLADMEAAGVDHQVLALTSPGTQVFDAATAHSLAVLANDAAAQAVRDHPERFSALAAVAFQDPAKAVAELRRAVEELGLKGLILNSHIGGEYIDAPRFAPILEAAEALDVPIYLHPNTPSDRMIGPLRDAGLDGAIYGFGVETGMHLLRMITSGIFDRFPRLRVVVGHLGEALPFWLSRLDYMHAGQVASGRYEAVGPLELRPSEYLRRNVWFTTSGMAWIPGIMFVREVIGADRVLYAMDYPYQYVPEEVTEQERLPVTPEEKKAFFESLAVDLFDLRLPKPGD
ncbi:2,3-dihydroxybenzoate decarboxylase [Lipingzhangella halophila]|uniref:2,3-dihydroxybenzoate decarboxylase n=1 Tax=Lipingzhangella halophila TaxID=1783352 RepID=A0A7W7RG29_9ACTN|nr:amidohydrolase family protein [Lipingzhangella halophila]MBB4931338.1 2,3-dihydroxybenzoate decarboxylase [Lipingzhangella halophila]